MSYNYKKEYKNWCKWKSKEEEQMRKLNVNEKIIDELREFDWQQFNEERRFRRKQDVTNENFFKSISVYDKRETQNIYDLLNEIENEAMYCYLSSLDEDILNVIQLKIMGYSVAEISKITGLSVSTIYYRIKKSRKNFIIFKIFGLFMAYIVKPQKRFQERSLKIE